MLRVSWAAMGAVLGNGAEYGDRGVVRPPLAPLVEVQERLARSLPNGRYAAEALNGGFLSMATGTVLERDLDAILSEYPDAGRDALIPLLQEVQEAHGYLSRDAILRIGRHLGLPASKIYGVATFYNQFRFQPVGKYHVQVCRGTACHVKGSYGVLEDVKQILKLQPGQTSRDGLFSLEVVACIGACGLAPVIRINEDFYAEMTPAKLDRVFKTLQKEANAHE